MPVLLSVGYAACHWCHVMAHESFEDDATAAYMNEHFVNIKVDREERPDVDAVYMQATTAMTGHGGWPMTVVLDHDGAPFFAGTYFPDRPRHGQPAFTQVLQSLAEAWQERGDEVRRVADNLREHLARSAQLPSGAVTAELLDGAVTTLAEEFDPMAGGFGNAPKFPPTWCSSSCGATAGTRHATCWPARVRRWQAAGCTTSSVAGSRATPSIAAGWCPTSRRCCTTTRSWSVSTPVSAPRRATGSPARPPTSFSASCAHPRAASRPRSMPTARPGNGQERRGPFYAWTPAQLAEALGDDHGPWAADLFAVTEAGTFEHGMSTLQLRHYPSDDLDRTRLADVKARLLAVRDERPRPGRDDKVVAAWNGLVISGLCDAGLLLGEQEYVDAAVAAGELLARLHVVDGSVLRVSRDGVAGPHAGVLEDYGCVASGFLSLVQATGDARWLALATGLLDHALAASALRTAASTTPTPTPRRWSPGRGTRETTPRRAGSAAWSTPW